jgi:hypothetical protein
VVPSDAEACGELECLAFGDAARAFAHVIELEKPRVLAIGEAHAPKGSENIDSSTKRFREGMLPQLEKKATDIVVEVMMPAQGCAPVEKKVVEKVEKPVTSGQRTTNKNEFVELANRAKALGVQPWALMPSCEQYKEITAAGDDGVIKMLTLIAQLTRERVETQLGKRGADAMVVAYGGALHNDLFPAPERKAWSFGPALSEAVGGRYVALEILVPEYIKDNDTWKRLPWYPHYDKGKNPGKATLFRTAPRSYVLIFAPTPEKN